MYSPSTDWLLIQVRPTASYLSKEKVLMILQCRQYFLSRGPDEKASISWRNWERFLIPKLLIFTQLVWLYAARTQVRRHNLIMELTKMRVSQKQDNIVFHKQEYYF